MQIAEKIVTEKYLRFAPRPTAASEGECRVSNNLTPPNGTPFEGQPEGAQTISPDFARTPGANTASQSR